MKKLLAILLCALMMLMPVIASAESLIPTLPTTTVVLSLPTGESFSADFGTAVNGDFVAKTEVEGAVYGLQVSADTAYVSIGGMNISIPFADVAEIVGTVMEAAGVTGGNASIALPEVNMDATIELINAIGPKLASLVEINSDETALTVAANISFAELWAACGEDLITWAKANTALIEFAASNSNSGMTAEDFLAALDQIGPMADQLDVTMSFNGVVDLAEAFPTASCVYSIASSGTEVASIAFALDSTGVSLEAGNAETKTNITVLFNADGSFTLMMDGSEVATVSFTTSDTPIEVLTDGSDAMPIKSLLNMVLSQK